MSKKEESPVGLEAVNKYFESAKAHINEKVKDVKLLTNLAQTLNVQPSTLVISTGLFLLTFLLFGIGGGLICNAVGFLYPAYKSFKAIESEKPEDDKLWLTYWVVYASFTLVETFADYILFWVPFYYMLKLGFLLWLFMPNTKGAVTVYTHLIRPYLTKHQQHIDGTLDQLGDRAGELVKDAAKQVGQAAVGAAAAGATLLHRVSAKPNEEK